MNLNTSKTLDNRRRFLQRLVAVGGLSLAGLRAEALATTAPRMTQGPYYPLADDIPLDKDNDLARVDDGEAALGQIHNLHGRVLDASGQPVRGALVELWHADHGGEYTYHTGVGPNPDCDPNFAGFGQFLTGSSGAYKFRTIKAGLYQGRARHFHIAVTIPGQTTRYCSQLGWNEIAYDLNGNQWSSQNSNDNIFASLTAEQKSLVLLDYQPVEQAVDDEVEASFDFQVSLTPVEPSYPEPGGLIVRGEPTVSTTSSQRLFKLSFPAYEGYTYEIYANPTLADLDWKALPFCLDGSGVSDRNKHTMLSSETLTLFVTQPAERGFYKVSYRVPGANTGTP